MKPAFSAVVTLLLLNTAYSGWPVRGEWDTNSTARAKAAYRYEQFESTRPRYESLVTNGIYDLPAQAAITNYTVSGYRGDSFWTHRYYGTNGEARIWVDMDTFDQPRDAHEYMMKLLGPGSHQQAWPPPLDDVSRQLGDRSITTESTSMVACMFLRNNVLVRVYGWHISAMDIARWIDCQLVVQSGRMISEAQQSAPLVPGSRGTSPAEAGVAPRDPAGEP